MFSIISVMWQVHSVRELLGPRSRGKRHGFSWATRICRGLMSILCLANINGLYSYGLFRRHSSTCDWWQQQHVQLVWCQNSALFWCFPSKQKILGPLLARAQGLPTSAPGGLAYWDVGLDKCFTIVHWCLHVGTQVSVYVWERVCVRACALLLIFFLHGVRILWNCDWNISTCDKKKKK